MSRLLLQLKRLDLDRKQQRLLRRRFLIPFLQCSHLQVLECGRPSPSRCPSRCPQGHTRYNCSPLISSLPQTAPPPPSIHQKSFLSQLRNDGEPVVPVVLDVTSGTADVPMEGGSQSSSDYQLSQPESLSQVAVSARDPPPPP
eukprot:766054-Hanusia_phi.AAC.7